MRSERKKGKSYEPNRMNPQQPVLDVAPLNCVPYMGPTNLEDMFSSPTKENAEAAEAIGPAIIFLSSQSTRDELDNTMAATKSGVALTGAAATGSVGSVIGKVEIGELEDSYYFRVSLPGVSMDKNQKSLISSMKRGKGSGKWFQHPLIEMLEFVGAEDFNCDIEPNGKVVIKGISTTERLHLKLTASHRLRPFLGFWRPLSLPTLHFTSIFSS
ncbi:hypothetical protein V6N13_052187 [Hibiscus sabdariffa]